MNITNIQLLAIIIFSVIIGIASIKIFTMYKDKKITEKEKEAINKIIIDIVKDALRLSTITNRNDLKNFCIDKVSVQFTELGITNFSKEDIEIAIDLVLKSMEDEVNKHFSNK